MRISLEVLERLQEEFDFSVREDYQHSFLNAPTTAIVTSHNQMREMLTRLLDLIRYADDEERDELINATQALVSARHDTMGKSDYIYF